MDRVRMRSVGVRGREDPVGCSELVDVCLQKVPNEGSALPATRRDDLGEGGARAEKIGSEATPQEVPREFS